MAEFVTNPVSTFLADVAGIDASVTSINVTDASLFPATFNYRVLVDTEIMLVTNIVGNVLTVVRGEEGTTPTVHSGGSGLTTALTAGGLTAVFGGGGGGGGGVVPCGGYAGCSTPNTPAAGTATIMPVDGTSVLFGGAAVDSATSPSDGVLAGTAGSYLVIAQGASAADVGADSLVGVGLNGSMVLYGYMSNQSGNSTGMAVGVLTLLDTDVVNLMVQFANGGCAPSTGLMGLTLLRVN